MPEPHALLLFVGYPRSGHSLVGALIDAHPQAIVSHELDLVARFLEGAGRAQLLQEMLDTSAAQAAAGRGQGHPGDYWYSYEVSGAWAGRVERELRVLGDKKGGGTTTLLAERPELLNELRAHMGLPLRLLHVVRDPFDNVASMVRRGHGDADAVIQRYAWLCGAVAEVLDREPQTLTLHHEALLASPQLELERLCTFLGLESDPRWLHAARGLLYGAPNRSRDAIQWSTQQRRSLYDLIERWPWLRRYRDEAPAPRAPHA